MGGRLRDWGGDEGNRGEIKGLGEGVGGREGERGRGRVGSKEGKVRLPPPPSPPSIYYRSRDLTFCLLSEGGGVQGKAF